MTYICTLKKFKRQHKPGPGDEGDVEEADEVPQESSNQHLGNIQFFPGDKKKQLYITLFGDILQCTFTWPYLVMNLKL